MGDFNIEGGDGLKPSFFYLEQAAWIPPHTVTPHPKDAIDFFKSYKGCQELGAEG